MESEERLFELCRKGNKDAFFKLVEPLLSRVYSTSAAILRSTHLAEDAVQNTLIEAYQAIIKGKKIRNFKSWINHLAACRALDLVRQRSRHANVSGNIDELELPDEHESPLEAVLKKERGSELLECVMSLDIHHRSVIALYYYQELSIDEIADVLGIKAGTVKSRLHTARLKLSQTASRLKMEQVIEC